MLNLTEASKRNTYFRIMKRRRHRIEALTHIHNIHIRVISVFFSINPDK